ncbi:MAG: NAD kinase [Muribaculaceae bacterium]|nr:NAD kinase [Muribaculaceae bacterium]
MVVAIYGSRRQGEYITRIARMLATLHENGVKIIMHSKLYRHLRSEVPGEQPVDSVVGDEPFDADVAISLGGDGTFLRTARWVGERQIPIVGVNTGHLGYLAAFNIEDIQGMVEDLLSGDYDIERRTLLKVECTDGTSLGDYPYALNEVAILKTEDASMITCSVNIDGSSPARYQADGLIVSTPTGSTGYNLSVGGPIIEPTAAVLVLSPIAAHSLTMRPLVISDSNRLTVETTCRSRSFLVSLDGNARQLNAGAMVEIVKAPFETLVIQRRGHRFTDTLRNKLLWGI